MQRARNSLVKLVVVGSVIYANVLGLSAAPARAVPSTARAPVRTIGPGRVVSMVHPPPAASHQGAGILPFFPRNRAAFDQGKTQAAKGTVGGRQGPAVHTIPRAQSQAPAGNAGTAGATATPAAGVSNNFHGDDLATQLAAFPSDQEVTPPDTTLATGNGDVVEPLNNTLSIYGTTGTLRARTDLYSFYASMLRMVTT